MFPIGTIAQVPAVRAQASRSRLFGSILTERCGLGGLRMEFYAERARYLQYGGEARVPIDAECPI